MAAATAMLKGTRNALLERICSNSGDTARTLYRHRTFGKNEENLTGSAALYQVAIALIPALMFGGAVLEIREGSPTFRSPRFGIAFALALAAGVFAEIIAIQGAIDPSVQNWERRYLVLVLTAGTAGLALWIATPTLQHATAGTRFRWGALGTGAALAISVIGGQIAITESLDHASTRINLERASEEIRQASRELNDAEQKEARNQADLLSLAQATQSTRSVGAVLTHLHQIDDRVLFAFGDGTLNEENAEKRIGIGFRRLNNIGQNLEQIFSRSPDLSAVQHELLLLQERRLISSIADVMGDREALLYADLRYRRACNTATFLGCK